MTVSGASSILSFGIALVIVAAVAAIWLHRRRAPGRPWLLVGMAVGLAGAVGVLLVNPPCASLVARTTPEGVEVVCLKDADVRNLALLAASGGVVVGLLILSLFGMRRRAAADDPAQ